MFKIFCRESSINRKKGVKKLKKLKIAVYKKKNMCYNVKDILVNAGILAFSRRVHCPASIKQEGNQ